MARLSKSRTARQHKLTPVEAAILKDTWRDSMRTANIALYMDFDTVDMVAKMHEATTVMLKVCELAEGRILDADVIDEARKAMNMYIDGRTAAQASAMMVSVPHRKLITDAIVAIREVLKVCDANVIARVHMTYVQDKEANPLWPDRIVERRKRK